jgi:hypothetical protein
MSDRGKWLQREDGLPVLVTLHPSALLRGDPVGRGHNYQMWVRDLSVAEEVPGMHKAKI